MLIYFMGEDSPEKTQLILKNIITKSLYHIEPCFNPNSDEFNIIPTDTFSQILQANLWKNSVPTASFDRLCRHITSVFMNEDEFIFWLIDADAPWSAEAALDQLDNIKKFEETILKKVEILYKKPISKSDFYQKVILMVPFYSIESWLYENYDGISRSHPAQHSELKKFKETHGDTLDTLVKIKELTRTKDTLNINLSDNFPTSKINNIGMSYTCFLNSLKENETLKGLIPKYTNEL